jgi:ABC-type Zn uptake system ZnuABC Zn-binding protein ZnuA
MKCTATAVLAAVACLAAGFSAAPCWAASDTLTVVTTTTDLKSLVEAVGGDHVKVTSIACGYEDPHFVQAKPSYMMTAREADLWIAIGMELEIGWEGLILEGSRNPKIRKDSRGYLDASQGVLRLEVPTEKVTRTMGDVHPLGNPHYWLDPLNARIVAKTIAGRLADLDPGHAEVFTRNLKAFQRKIDERMFGKELVDEVGGDKLWLLELKGGLQEFLDERHLAAKMGGWAGTMLPFRGEKILTYHKSWTYFVNRFGLVVADQLEPKPGIPPSPGHVLAVIEQVKSGHIRTLLMEPFYERKAPDLIAEKTGLKVVVCANSVGGDEAAKDYFSMIGNVVDKLAAALKPASEPERK